MLLRTWQHFAQGRFALSISANTALTGESEFLKQILPKLDYDRGNLSVQRLETYDVAQV